MHARRHADRGDLGLHARIRELSWGSWRFFFNLVSTICTSHSCNIAQSFVTGNGDCAALSTGTRRRAPSVAQRETTAGDVEREASGEVTIAYLVVRLQLCCVLSFEHPLLCRTRSHSWEIGSWRPKEVCIGSPGVLTDGAGASLLLW